LSEGRLNTAACVDLSGLHVRLWSRRSHFRPSTRAICGFAGPHGGPAGAGAEEPGVTGSAHTSRYVCCTAAVVMLRDRGDSQHYDCCLLALGGVIAASLLCEVIAASSVPGTVARAPVTSLYVPLLPDAEPSTSRTGSTKLFSICNARPSPRLQAPTSTPPALRPRAQAPAPTPPAPLPAHASAPPARRPPQLAGATAAARPCARSLPRAPPPAWSRRAGPAAAAGA
jgi:hypothetical protein